MTHPHGLIPEYESGKGNGRVGFVPEWNPDANERTGTISIAGQSFTIVQKGGKGSGATIPKNSSTEKLEMPKIYKPEDFIKK